MAGLAFVQFSYVSAQTAPEASGDGVASASSASSDADAVQTSQSEKSAIRNVASEEKSPPQQEGAETAGETSSSSSGSAAGAAATAASGEAAPAESAADSAGAAAGPSSDGETGASQQTEAPALPAEPEPVRIDPKDVTLTIATWSGAYGQSQDRAIFRPFAEKTGYQIGMTAHDGDYEPLESSESEPEWSLADLNAPEMIRACREGRLEKLDHTILEPAPTGAPLSEDFLPGAVHECGIASMAWSAVLVIDSRLDSKPASMRDFFDIGNFPGKRILPMQPRYSLELALLADGVAPADVYTILKTPEGQDRAFAKLSSIKDEIIWWEDPAEVPGRIVDREAIMGLAFNGRAFMSIVASENPLEIVWDNQIYTYDYWSIPRGAAFLDQAKEFIGYATSAETLAAQAAWLPYGPARRSAAEMVGKHPEIGIEMKPYLPTSEANLATALRLDSEFWTANEASLEERFADWVQGRQLPPQKNAMLEQ